MSCCMHSAEQRRQAIARTDSLSPSPVDTINLSCPPRDPERHRGAENFTPAPWNGDTPPTKEYEWIKRERRSNEAQFAENGGLATYGDWRPIATPPTQVSSTLEDLLNARKLNPNSRLYRVSAREFLHRQGVQGVPTPIAFVRDNYRTKTNRPARYLPLLGLNLDYENIAFNYLEEGWVLFSVRLGDALDTGGLLYQDTRAQGTMTAVYLTFPQVALPFVVEGCLINGELQKGARTTLSGSAWDQALKHKLTISSTAFEPTYCKTCGYMLGEDDKCAEFPLSEVIEARKLRGFVLK